MDYAVRTYNSEAVDQLRAIGLQKTIARLYAQRGATPEEVQTCTLEHMLDPSSMKGMRQAVERLVIALDTRERIVIVGDYDCDGATATAIGIRGLRMLATGMGQTQEQCENLIRYMVPNRNIHGYGLSPTIVSEVADQFQAQLIVTVDNGIASGPGVEKAKELGIDVVVTDHHLPGENVPAAAAIVNPNQAGCEFKSKSIAGCGVMFCVLLALEKELLSFNKIDSSRHDQLKGLIDIVAVGTVADVVKLDVNNRRFVTAGIKRIREGRCVEGIKALLKVSGQPITEVNTQTLGFQIGPRLNAAGRLDDMKIGIECLLTDDPTEASALATQLHDINQKRKEIQNDIAVEAAEAIEETAGEQNGIVLSNDRWHHGVIGIVASKVKDAHHRPTIILAPESEDGTMLRGSGRSIPGVHLRDVIDLCAKRLPADAIPKFGGHAAAAGLTLASKYLYDFRRAFNDAIAELGEENCLQKSITTDGTLSSDEMTLEVIDLISSEIWGQGFPAPTFRDNFSVIEQKILKEQHSRFILEKGGKKITALYWNSTDLFEGRVSVVYRLAKNDFRGQVSLQLMIDDIQRVPVNDLGDYLFG